MPHIGLNLIFLVPDETGGIRGKAETELQGTIGELYYSAAVLVEPQGRLCNCGRRGCLEAMVGGAYLGLDAQAMVAAEPQGILARLAKEHGIEISSE